VIKASRSIMRPKPGFRQTHDFGLSRLIYRYLLSLLFGLETCNLSQALLPAHPRSRTDGERQSIERM